MGTMGATAFLDGESCSGGDAKWKRNYHRFYSPEAGRYTQVDPALAQFNKVLSSGATMAVSLLSAIPERPELFAPYQYALSNPILLYDPSGLYQCRSGKCADCPSGRWTGVYGSAGGAVVVGYNASYIRLQCDGSNEWIAITQRCLRFIGLGGSAEHGIMACKGAFCKEDLTAKTLNVFANAGAGPVSVTASYGTSTRAARCAADSVGGGVGYGLGVDMCF